MKLPGWFRPRYSFEKTWVHHANLAIRVASTKLPRHPKAPAGFVKDTLAEQTVAVCRSATANGLAAFRDAAGRSALLNAHYADMIESAYPGCTWVATETALSQTGGSLHAYVGKRAVAIVMQFMGTAEGMTSVRPPDEPPCPKCDGTGGKDRCATCDGAGEVEHECSCGDTHECECETCDGHGWTKRCGLCEGSGKWAPRVAKNARAK